MKQLVYMLMASSLSLFASCITNNNSIEQISERDLRVLSLKSHEYVKNADKITANVSLMKNLISDSIAHIKIPEINADVNNSAKYSSEIFDTIYVVPLETTEESIIGEINKLKIIRDTIYIHDKYTTRTLKRFTKDGKFIDQIGSLGQGKGEYLRLFDFCVTDKEIIISDVHKILIYDLSGKFIREKEDPFSYSLFAKTKNDKYIFKAVNPQNYHLDDMLNYCLWTTDTSLIINKKGLWREYKKNDNYDSDLGLSETNGSYYVFDVFSDSIYTITENDDLECIAVLDFQGRSNKDLYRVGNSEEFQREWFKDKYYFFNKAIITTDYIYIDFQVSGIRRNLFYSKKSGQTKCFTILYPDEINITYGNCQNLLTAFGNTLVGSLDAAPLAELDTNGRYEEISKKIKKETNSDVGEITKKLIKSLKPDDNPILVFYKLKEW